MQYSEPRKAWLESPKSTGIHRTDTVSAIAKQLKTKKAISRWLFNIIQ
jgi:hypothetical protein